MANEDFKNATRCWISGNDCFHNDVKEKDHCPITREHRGSAHRDFSIIVKLNRKFISYFKT